MITRLALYAALGLVLSTGLECHIDQWQFWAVVGLFWASESLTRMETYNSIEEEVERLRAERKEKNRDQT